MAEKQIVNSRYMYKHETGNCPPPQSVDIHHVVVRKSGSKHMAFYAAVGLLLIAFCVLLGEGKAVSVLILYLGISVFFIKLVRRKLVERESVVIFTALGVQLETHYRSGKAVRRFVPIDKILKPVLSECVTPVTCYWSLALILREEDELMLVFKDLRPPLKMLLPVWKALCAAAETEGN